MTTGSPNGRPGDVIVQVQGTAVHTPQDVTGRIAADRKAGKKVELLLVNRGHMRELSARIRALSRRSEQAATLAPAGAPVVDLGRVQVDLAGHRLLRDGEALPIKPKAFELLVFLLRNPGQAFTRDQLLEHVWGYDYAGETRTVDVHVHWLRSRIETDPSNPEFLHTVRGVGYVFRRPA